MVFADVLKSNLLFVKKKNSICCLQFVQSSINPYLSLTFSFIAK